MNRGRVRIGAHSWFYRFPPITRIVSPDSPQQSMPVLPGFGAPFLLRAGGDAGWQRVASGFLTGYDGGVESAVARLLDLLDEQREAVFGELGALADAVLWYRPRPRVWSIGEHLDHTRVTNCLLRRLLIAYYPVASIFARPFRHQPYKSEIEDIWQRPGFHMRLGWFLPPKYTPRRPVTVQFLHDALRAEHTAWRGFFNARDEQLLGHTIVFDPLVGALNLVQCLRLQVYHDAHHYERVRARIREPECRANVGRTSKRTRDRES